MGACYAKAMNSSHLQRLSKVLALVDSSHDGEAVAAVRMAKQLLSQNGMSFADLAHSTTQTSASLRAAAGPSYAAYKINETQLAVLQLKVRQMQEASKLQTHELAHARMTVTQLQAALTQANEEAEKWRALARDTANKLWDLGQQIEKDRTITQGVVSKLQEIAPTSKPAMARVVAPSQFSRERRFVRNSLLDAQEVEAFAAVHLAK